MDQAGWLRLDLEPAQAAGTRHPSGRRIRSRQAGLLPRPSRTVSPGGSTLGRPPKTGYGTGLKPALGRALQRHSDRAELDDQPIRYSAIGRVSPPQPTVPRPSTLESLAWRIQILQLDASVGGSERPVDGGVPLPQRSPPTRGGPPRGRDLSRQPGLAGARTERVAGWVQPGQRSAREGVSATTRRGARQLPPPECETLATGPTRGRLGGHRDLRSGGSESAGRADRRPR